MASRITSVALLFVAALALLATAPAQARILEAPLQFSSLEWLVAESGAIVRGTIVDIETDHSWHIVTLEVRETLKGAKAERVRFIAPKCFEPADTSLLNAKENKTEQVWILNRHSAHPAVTSARRAIGGQTPDREGMLARHKLDLYAPSVPGRPGAPALPAIALTGEQPLAFFTIDLRVLKDPQEMVKAIRTAIAEPVTASGRSFALEAPIETAKKTGFHRMKNLVLMPVDRRLEAFAQNLVLSPAKHGPELRLEGVKALRLFPSEKNLAIVRVWLDDPTATDRPETVDLQRILPAVPKVTKAAATPRIALPEKLEDVPEIQLQSRLTNQMKTPAAQLHTAVSIDAVHHFNKQKTDAFIDSLRQNRPDLAGLPFAMGAKCRLPAQAGRNFAAAIEAYRKSESEILKEKAAARERLRTFTGQLAEKKIDPSAGVNALMQVLAPENAAIRLDLVAYLQDINTPDATKALGRLAIFSTEREIHDAAVAALKGRNPKDYTDLVVAGLSYPWPDVAERASDTIVKLDRKDLIPSLIDALDRPDPRAPRQQDGPTKATVVRELVRLNHHHNCLLCHAPVTSSRDALAKLEIKLPHAGEALINNQANDSAADAAKAVAAKDEADKLHGLTAQIPVPSESLVAYYRPDAPDILVRFDITYLRQDFSQRFQVANSDPWPEMQRYDFLVRTREISPEEAAALTRLLDSSTSPYRRAAQTALRSITGRDAEPHGAAWRKVMGL